MLHDVLLEIIPGQLVDGVSDKVWIVVGAGVAFLVVLAIILVVHARRAKPYSEAEAAAGFAWDETDGGRTMPMQDEQAMPAMDPGLSGPEASPEPIAEQVHQTRCPTCRTEFQVTGQRPLTMVCPNCGQRGTLR
jgi:hypothetical protein